MLKPVSNAVQAFENHLRGESMEALDDEDVRGGGEGRCRPLLGPDERPAIAGRKDHRPGPGPSAPTFAEAARIVDAQATAMEEGQRSTEFLDEAHHKRVGDMASKVRFRNAEHRVHART